MINQLMRHWRYIPLIFLSFAMSACDYAPALAEDEKEVIVFGLGPSAYHDQVEKGIRPYLEAKGYQVESKIFSQNSLIPLALLKNEVDVSVHISTANMIEMNRRLNGDMIVWADTASAPQSLRSLRHQSLDDVKDGMTVAVPNDPVNVERAVRILEELDWVEIAPDLEIATFHINEVKPKKYNLKLIEMESAQMLRALPDLDFAIINGNFIVSAKQKISDGLYVENSPEEHLVKVAIRDSNRETQWAKDIQEAYQSAAFEEYVKSDPLYDGFIFPRAWSDKNHTTDSDINTDTSLLD